MYEINIADKKMLREMVQEAINLRGDSQRYMMSDLTEEMELRYERLTGRQTEDLQIRIQAEKELYSLVESPKTPTPLLDQLTDLTMLRQRITHNPHALEEFIKTYGPNAGLEAGAETDPAEA